MDSLFQGNFFGGKSYAIIILDLIHTRCHDQLVWKTKQRCGNSLKKCRARSVKREVYERKRSGSNEAS